MTAERQLTIGEIIARHQQQQRAQDALGAATTSPTRACSSTSGRRSPIPATTCVTENRYFVAGDGVEWEELSFSVNGIEVGRRSPAVSAPAAGEGAVAAAAAALRRGLPLPPDRHRARSTSSTATSCEFEPVRRTARSIAAPSGSTGRRSRGVRVQAVQSGLVGAGRVRTRRRSATRRSLVGNRPVFLFSGLIGAADRAHRRPQPAGREEVAFTDFHVNDPDFERERGVGPRERSRDVPRDRSRAALLRQGRRRAGRQRPRHAIMRRRWRWASRSIRRTRFPLPIFGIDYLEFRVRLARTTQLAHAVCRRARRRATSSGRRSARRVSTRASTSSRSPSPSSDRVYDAGRAKRQASAC